MSATQLMAKSVVDIQYDDLPIDVVAATKKQVLDTLAAVVAGSMSENVKRLLELYNDWGGREESTILGFGGKVPCANAAQINAWSASVLDFDDFHDRDFMHASRVVVPVSMAVAEHKGAVSGKDFITAVALGFDFACRMGRAALVHRESGFLSAPNFFGAAASAGKIIGLNEPAMKHALGLALMQVTPEGYGIREGLNNKGIEVGFEARAGVFAALMAERGLAGPGEPIEGNRWGFYGVFHRGLYNEALLTVDLGTVFAVSTVSQKPYPGCRFIHTAISATLDLVKENEINADDVEKVTVYHGPIAQAVCAPLDIKRKPENAIRTQHSLPWSVASAIVYGKVGIEPFTEDALRDVRILNLAQKVVPRLAPELAQIPVAEPAIVEIRARGGKIYTKRVDIAPGDPEAPMSFEDVVEKFNYCCGFSAKPVPRGNREKVVEMVAHLEDVRDVQQIADLLG